MGERSVNADLLERFSFDVRVVACCIKGMFGLFRKRTPFEAISGGDGSSPQQAMVLNCASVGMARKLIDDVLSNELGVEDRDWTNVLEFFLPDANGPERFIRCIVVKVPPDGKRNFYFDMTRAMRVLDKMRGA